MPTSPIKLDKSDSSIVLTCDLCPWWSALAIGKPNAWTSAEQHERIAHPELPQVYRQARYERESYARRAAAAREMPREPEMSR
ncbi:hypothetical protein [Microbacterium rhizophilus]|uniref:hypothetical protein n=1 Tax=Microbacterium rhizophilus TaxID=3138934 RepID=UPI0031EB5B94